MSDEMIMTMPTPDLEVSKMTACDEPRPKALPLSLSSHEMESCHRLDSFSPS
jgi:hypothetical protein